jgi:hypothetical protein
MFVLFILFSFGQSNVSLLLGHNKRMVIMTMIRGMMMMMMVLVKGSKTTQ